MDNRVFPCDRIKNTEFTAVHRICSFPWVVMFVTKALIKRMVCSVAQTIDQIIWKMFGLGLSVL